MLYRGTRRCELRELLQQQRFDFTLSFPLPKEVLFSFFFVSPRDPNPVRGLGS